MSWYCTYVQNQGVLEEVLTFEKLNSAALFLPGNVTDRSMRFVSDRRAAASCEITWLRDGKPLTLLDCAHLKTRSEGRDLSLILYWSFLDRLSGGPTTLPYLQAHGPRWLRASPHLTIEASTGRGQFVADLMAHSGVVMLGPEWQNCPFCFPVWMPVPPDAYALLACCM